MVSAEYILRHSLCRAPYCAGPYELRETPLKDWPQAAIDSWRRSAESEIEYMDFAKDYAEPGYDKPERGILFANWNYFPNKVADLLEQAGYSVEWSDEWAMCDCCNKALRTSPNSYSWQPSYVESEDGRHCLDCLDADDIAATYEDNPSRAVNAHGIDLAAFGYVEIQCGYESGWYGTEDDPKAIYAKLVKRGYQHIVFQISDVEQFRIAFCVWHKPEDGED